MAWDRLYIKNLKIYFSSVEHFKGHFLPKQFQLFSVRKFIKINVFPNKFTEGNF